MYKIFNKTVIEKNSHIVFQNLNLMVLTDPSEGCNGLEISISIYPLTWHLIPSVRIHQLHGCENLKNNLLFF